MADGQGSNPHDRLFRFAFRQLDIARDQIRAVLPPEVVAELRLDQIQIDTEHLPEPDLSDRFCDVLYRIPGIDGSERFVWLLLEHQSTDQPLMAFRLLEYVIRIWGRWVRCSKASAKLPVIVPVVLSHAPGGWRSPTRLRDLVDAPGPILALLGSAVPDFEYVVDDLTRVGPEAVASRSDRAALRLVLWALQCRGRVSPDDVDAWREAFRDLLRDERWRDVAQAVLAYVTQTDEADDPVAFQAARTADSELERVVTSYAERLIEEGRAEGLTKGRAEGEAEGLTRGRAEGEAEVVVRLLTRKFGELSADLEAKIRSADSETLLAWADRVLDAQTLDEVFVDA